MALATATVCLAWSGFLALQSNATYTQTVSNLGLMGVALAAGLQALRRSRRESGGAARAWLLLGLGCLSWGSGQAAWTWYESVLGREVPFPSIADVGYLLFVPLVAAALLAFPSAPRRLSTRIRTVLDGLLIAERPAVHELDGGRRPAVRGRGRPVHAGDRSRVPDRRRGDHHDPAVRIEPSPAPRLDEPGQPAAPVRRPARLRRRRQRLRVPHEQRFLLVGQPDRHRLVLRLRGDLPRRHAGSRRSGATDRRRRRAGSVRRARAVRPGRARRHSAGIRIGPRRRAQQVPRMEHAGAAAARRDPSGRGAAREPLARRPTSNNAFANGPQSSTAANNDSGRSCRTAAM